MVYDIRPNARIVVKLDPITGNSDIVGFAQRSNVNGVETLAIVLNSQYDTKINPKAY